MKDKKIIIEIPDDLSEKDEAILIAKKISKKMLQIAASGSGGKKKQKKIGNQQFDNFKLPTSQIEIVRMAPKSKLSAMITCYCGTMFNKKEGKPYFTNYGGIMRKNHCCSAECREVVIANFGNRVSITKNKLSHLFFDR